MNFRTRNPRPRLASRCLLILALGLICQLCFAGTIDPAALTLYQLIQQRLALMRAVAAEKFAHQRAVEDLQREAEVINASVAAARQLNLPVESSGLFFRAQIEAAKDIQRYWITQWQSGRAAPALAGGELLTELRPRLDQLSEQILAQIALIGDRGSVVMDTNHRARFNAIVATPGLGPERIDQMFVALVPLVESRARLGLLARVENSGRLRVGMTGDYPPFSSLEQGRFQGLEVEFARRLATSLKVELELVQTTWPSLMKDLELDRFDIAMSGISWSGERSQRALFGLPYLHDGKVALCRCQDLSKFVAPHQLDRPDVRLIVNPGGTNEQYAKQHFQQAQLRIYPDNLRIFEEIVSGRADLMITDGIEARLQAIRHPTLCVAMDGRLLTHLEKAWLMPEDLAFKRYVDAWLHQFRQGSEFADLLRRHLPAGAPP